MMTKRLRVLLLAGVAVLSMAAFYGCGGTDDSTTDSSTAVTAVLTQRMKMRTAVRTVLTILIRIMKIQTAIMAQIVPAALTQPVMRMLLNGNI